MSKDDEKILVVPTEKLYPTGIKEGFFEIEEKNFLDLVKKNHLYMRRGDAETDEKFQQIVAQIILKVGGKIFIHRVPQSGSESRLHDMWPIFLGGHINNTDINIQHAVIREFNEEIKYKGKIKTKKFWGLVKLNDNPVNKVHVGMVWIFEGDTEEIEETGDEGVIDGKFVEIKNLNNYLQKMTYWSKVVTPNLIRKYGD
jgi:predicted NUDIX family phosphoesterase